ncbi:MAG: hypothetical protein G01um101417_477, partial [Parcubacteria group bacterium Gr01-1014_17]
AKIGSGEFLLRVAQTESERERGLSGVTALAKDEGMLFSFPQNAFHTIWMKNMLIPIDIIWLSDEFFVIDIRENASPDSFPEIFSPKQAARFVVELPAGSAKASSITIGSRAEFFAGTSPIPNGISPFKGGFLNQEISP